MNVVRHSDSFVFSVHSGMEAARYSETVILTSILTIETTGWNPPLIKCIFITQKTVIWNIQLWMYILSRRLAHSLIFRFGLTLVLKERFLP